MISFPSRGKPRSSLDGADKEIKNSTFRENIGKHVSKFPERLCYKSQFCFFGGVGSGSPSQKKRKEKCFQSTHGNVPKKTKKTDFKISSKVKRVGGFNAFLGK